MTPRYLVALLAGTLLMVAAISQPAAAQGAKDKQRAAECDEQIKKQKDWDEFAKRRWLEQCLQQGVTPPAQPDRTR